MFAFCCGIKQTNARKLFMMPRSYNNDLRWRAIRPGVADWDPQHWRNAEHYAVSRKKKKKKVSRSLLLSFQITPFFSTPRLFTIKKSFQKIRLESRWNVPLGSFQRKISGSNGTSEKVVLFFRTEYSKRKFVFDFFKAIFDTSFRPSRSFFGKWNWFVQCSTRFRGEIYPSWILTVPFAQTVDRLVCPSKRYTNYIYSKYVLLLKNHNHTQSPLQYWYYPLRFADVTFFWNSWLQWRYLHSTC